MALRLQELAQISGARIASRRAPEPKVYVSMQFSDQFFSIDLLLCRPNHKKVQHANKHSQTAPVSSTELPERAQTKTQT